MDGSIVHGITPKDYSALTLLALWTRIIKETPENCLVISVQIFNLEHVHLILSGF